MPRRHVLLSCLFLIAISGTAVCDEKLPEPNKKILAPTSEWVAKIKTAAPAKPTVAAPKRKVLVFSLFTGFDHKVIPHVDRVFEVLAEKTGAFDATITRDIEALDAKNLAGYDVLVLNNNCSKNPDRALFMDELKRNPKYKDMTEEGRQAKAKSLEQSLLDFVSGGKGLVVIHGAPTMLNKSKEFTEMVGGAFHYHPPNQYITTRTVDAEHPLVAAFRGKEPFIHRDEPYCFNGPYEQFNFRPLLSIDTKGLKDKKNGTVEACVRYVAWVKPHGAGRVFFCSPSHFPESYESPTLLRFVLDGVQYAAGDLKCDDSPLKK